MKKKRHSPTESKGRLQLFGAPKFLVDREKLIPQMVSARSASGAPLPDHADHYDNSQNGLEIKLCCTEPASQDSNPERGSRSHVDVVQERTGRKGIR